MSLKSEYGDAAHALWDSWSRQDDRPKHGYNAHAANSTWKACKPKAGGVTIGTLYYLAKQHGWTGERPAPIIRSPEETKKAYDRHRQEVDRIEADHASRRSHGPTRWLMTAEMAEHPYLGV